MMIALEFMANPLPRHPTQLLVQVNRVSNEPTVLTPCSARPDRDPMMHAACHLVTAPRMILRVQQTRFPPISFQCIVSANTVPDTIYPPNKPRGSVTAV
jgi:hypothetical protein